MRLNHRLIFAGVSLAALATPAFAQDAPADDSSISANEIIVQARRRDESIQDVPQVVNAVTSQQLERLNIRELKDVTSVVPGLNLAAGANGIGGVATLRGVNFDVNASGNNGTVEFYLNDAPISAQVVLQSMFDVGQIEVLRGPQGTLRGRASPSGSITIATRKPDLDEIGGYLNATANSIGGINAQGGVNLPIIKGMLALRVAALVDDNEANRVHSVTSPAVEPYGKTRSERVSLRFAPGDSIDILGSYQHFINHTQSFDQVESANLANGLLPASPTTIGARDLLAVADIPRNFRQQYDIFNLQGEWRFAGLKLNYVGSWNKTTTVTVQPNDPGNFFGSAYPGNALSPNDPFTTTYGTTPNFHNASQQTNSRAIQQSHEIRLSSEERLFGMADFVIGALSYRSAPPFELWSQTPLFLSLGNNTTVTPALATGVVTLAPGFTLPTFIGYTNAQITQENTRSLERSVFGNVTLHFGEATELSGGLRYINYKNHAEKYISTAGRTGVTKSPLGLAVTDDFKPLIYAISLKHRFNDNIMAYASTGSSWRASAQTNGIIDRDDLLPWGVMSSLLHLPPETSKSYELGFKSEWLDRRLMLNVTYFHQDFKDYFYSSQNVQVAQRLAIPAGGSLTAANVGDVYQLATMSPALAVGVPVKVDGIEADFSYRATPHFSLGGSVSYSLAKIRNGVVPCNLPTQPASGAALVAATGGQQLATCQVSYRAGAGAPFSANLQAEYNRPVTNAWDGFIRALATIKGASQNDPSNAIDDVSGHALVNLYLGLRDHDGGWELTAFAKNLFNTRRVLSRDANPLAAAAQFLAPNFANLGGFPQNTSYRAVTTTPQREFGLNLRIAFGSR